jgi:hypothetical protein
MTTTFLVFLCGFCLQLFVRNQHPIVVGEVAGHSAGIMAAEQKAATPDSGILIAPQLC